MSSRSSGTSRDAASRLAGLLKIPGDVDQEVGLSRGTGGHVAMNGDLPTRAQGDDGVVHLSRDEVDRARQESRGAGGVEPQVAQVRLINHRDVDGDGLCR